jgi:hypothetical protein
MVVDVAGEPGISGYLQLSDVIQPSGEDRTAIELFGAGVQGWDTGLRRVLAASVDEK